MVPIPRQMSQPITTTMMVSNLIPVIATTAVPRRITYGMLPLRRHRGMEQDRWGRGQVVLPRCEEEEVSPLMVVRRWNHRAICGSCCPDTVIDGLHATVEVEVEVSVVAPVTVSVVIFYIVINATPLENGLLCRCCWNNNARSSHIFMGNNHTSVISQRMWRRSSLFLFIWVQGGGDTDLHFHAWVYTPVEVHLNCCVWLLKVCYWHLLCAAAIATTTHNHPLYHHKMPKTSTAYSSMLPPPYFCWLEEVGEILPIAFID